MKYVLITMLLILAGCFSSRSDNAEKAPPQVSNGKTESVLPPDRQKVADLEGQLAKAKAEVEERLKQEREKSDASWRFWTRLVSALGVPLAAIVFVLGLKYGVSRISVPLSGSLAVGCTALLIFGESLPWIRIFGPIAAVVAIVGVSVVAIVRQRKALGATARLGDAIETGVNIEEAKKDARRLQEKAGAWLDVQVERRKKPIQKIV